jgi:hypothetical protein
MSLKHLADELAARGRYGDTELVHMTKGEVAGLQQLAESAGGSLTINPDTGKPEAFFLAALLPSLLGGIGSAMGLGAFGTAALGAGVGALGAKAQGKNPLMGAVMGGFGGYGGGQLANALGAAGSAGTAMGSAIPQQAAAELARTEAAKQAVAAGATGQGSQAAMLAAQNMGAPTAQLAATTMAPNTMAAAGQGLAALGTDAGRSAALQSLGGAKGALKAGSMAAAPAMYGYMTQMPRNEEDEEEMALPRYDYTAGLTGDYYGMGGDGSTRERQFFTQPTFTRRAAAGGTMDLAEGGIAELARGGMKAGGFVVPADVVSMVGEGNTDAGYERIKRMLPGATPIKGKDGGQADTVKTSIEGKQPARIAHGEMYVPPAAVKRAGGAKKLYAMMDKVRQQATGNKKQIKPVDVRKALA